MLNDSQMLVNEGLKDMVEVLDAAATKVEVALLKSKIVKDYGGPNYSERLITLRDQLSGLALSMDESVITE